MRVRLRPAPTAADLAAMYPVPHDHRAYGYSHSLRVDCTVALGVAMLEESAQLRAVGTTDPEHVATVRQSLLATTRIVDLSCGNGEIARQTHQRIGSRVPILLGDFAPGDHLTVTGPIEETMDLVAGGDLLICSETIEHLDDPDAVLAAARHKFRHLLVTTPIGETDDGNREHLWGWDQDGVADMLGTAGWTTGHRVDLILADTYSYQLWWCW